MQIQDQKRLPELDHQYPLPTIGRSIDEDQRPQHLGKIQTALLGSRTNPSGMCEAPRILGVDDLAWRRGQRYGTILVDLETDNVVDFLPDREKETLLGWITHHSGVEIIAQNRAGADARGAHEGAPNALSVADRWPLLRNCSDGLQNVVERRSRGFLGPVRVVRTVVALNPVGSHSSGTVEGA